MKKITGTDQVFTRNCTAVLCEEIRGHCNKTLMSRTVNNLTMIKFLK